MSVLIFKEKDVYGGWRGTVLYIIEKMLVKVQLFNSYHPS